MKFTGAAHRWFHSKPDFVEKTTNELLEEMGSMFQHKVSKMALRRRFESRRWHSSEAFSEYFHEKRILANQVSLSEEEMIEYIIDGIPDIQLQNQARLQKFESASAILQAFEKITMTRREEKHPKTGAEMQ